MSAVLSASGGDRVTVSLDGLVVGGRARRLLSGEVHPWRHDPADWGRVLDGMQDLGFETVSCYVPWARHEISKGRFDFTGPLDIEAFLRLVHERGMLAVVRVGPNAGAEQEDSGWPRRVLDDPACQARRPGGAPYLLATATHHAWMPSYASLRTLREVAGWYDEVVRRLAPLQWPAGPIVACQVDNEIGYHFQSHAFALDFHPDAVGQYREFLAQEYLDVEVLNTAYGTTWRSFDEVEPPTDGSCEPEAWRVDWVRFREHHLRRSLQTLASMLRERGMDRVPLVHNDYPRTTTPMDIAALEASGAVDVAGADVYVTKEGGRYVRELARHLAGSSTLPYMAELGTGWLTLPWLLPMRTTPLDEEHVALRAYVHGVRAANVYMLVERDRWYGSPLSNRGEPREPKAGFYRRLHRMLEELDWGTLRRDAPVLVLENRDVSRRVASRAVLGEVVPCFSQVLPLDVRLFSPDDDEAERATAWECDMLAELDRLGLDADRAASSSLPDLSPYDAVAVYDAASLDPAVQKRLQGSIVVSDPSQLADLVRPPQFSCDVAAVDLVRHTGGGREVLCAVNGSPETVQTRLRTTGSVRLTGRWTREELVAGPDGVDVRLEPWAVQVWEVQR